MASSGIRVTAVALCAVLAFAFVSAKVESEPEVAGHVLAMEEHHRSKSIVEVRGLKGMTKDTLGRMLEYAEAQYQSNMKRRMVRLGEAGVETLGSGDFESVMLPAPYSCPVESRMGSWSDNGKWVCLSHYGSGRKEAVALTFGTGCDTTFERDIFESLDVRTSMYDFDLSARTVDEMQSLHFIDYKNAGLTGSKKLEAKKTRFPSVNWVTLPSALRSLGVKYADIVKIDCEGCEVDVVRDMAAVSNRTHPIVGQLLLEVHDVADWKLPKVRGLFTTLSSLGFRVFHTEVNPYYKMHYEVALIHESLVKPRGSTQQN